MIQSDDREPARRLFRPEPATEVDDELAFHLEMRTRELVEGGVPEREARERALARFGSLASARDECLSIVTRRQRSMARAEYLHEFLQDAHYAVRTLSREPRFAAGVLVALALGIGAATTVFSVLDAVVLRPLPYADPDRLVRLSEVERTQPDRPLLVASANYLDWSKQLKSFSAIAATYPGGRTTLTGSGEPVVLKGVLAAASLSEALGVAPRLGRWFRSEDDRAGSAPVVVLGHGLWQQRFGSEERVLGSRVVLDGVPATVIGVMPAGFDYPGGAELWRPLFGILPADFTTIRHYRFLEVIGRIRSTTTPATARADLERVAAGISALHPRVAEFGATFESLTDTVVGPSRPRMLMLFGAVLLLLLITCANVASLLLVRGGARAREMSVRVALGAGRGRLLRQLGTESLVLALAGAVLGLALALALVPTLIRVSPVELPRLNGVTVNARVLLFAIGISVLAAFLFGLMPAVTLLRTAPQAGIASARVVGSRAYGGRAHAAIVVGELALSLVLLSSAGLLFRGFVRLAGVDPGFQPEQLTTVKVALPNLRYARISWERPLLFWRQALDELGRLPGVTSVSASDNPPVSGTAMESPIRLEGRPDPPTTEAAVVATVLPGYFRTMAIPRLAGRDFTWSDSYDTPQVVIVNQSFVRRYFPIEDPLGKKVRASFGPPVWREIVGVVADVHHRGQANEPPVQMFMPRAQQPSDALILIVRASTPREPLARDIRAVIRRIDPEIPIERIATMDDLLSGTIALPRFLTAALAMFALLALGVALLGVYSVMAYVVARRTPELGVRLALGASPQDIRGLVLGRAAGLAGVGVLLGVVGAYGAMRLMRGLIYGTESADPLLLVGSAIILGTGVVLASLAPARRASRIDPVVSLRAE